MIERKGPEKYRIDDAKHRSARTDSEGERTRRHEGESPVFIECSKSIPKIVKKQVHLLVCSCQSGDSNKVVCKLPTAVQFTVTPWLQNEITSVIQTVALVWCSFSTLVVRK
jgi:hypothetical protein